MKLNDIIFAIGITIIASLLVFVVYDDTIGSSQQRYIEEGMEVNISEDGNISYNNTTLKTDIVNDTINAKTNQKTENTYTQSSNSYTPTQKSNTKSSSIQNSNTPKDNVNNNPNIETQYKNSNNPNTHNDKTIGENKPHK